jgi:bifunctional ADP-heptose synthase (sugar kinase/adenylyltransferase)
MKGVDVKKVESVLAVLLFAATARAGEVYGTVTEAGKPVAAGMALKLACGDASTAAKTDAYGSYSVKINATGKCTLTVASLAGAPSITVNVYEKSARYDLTLAQSGGKYTISRK